MKNYKVLYFYSETCAPCRSVAPRWDKYVKEHEGNDNVSFVKVNTMDGSTETQDLLMEHNIRSIPSFILIEDDVVILKEMGLRGFDEITTYLKEKS